MSNRQRRRQDKQRRHGRALPSRRKVAAAGGAALGASLITGASAQAATFTVDKLADTSGGACTAAANDCSLREALAANDANNNQPTVDDILFDSSLSGTINAYGVLTTSEPVNIQGPGAGQVTVNEAAFFCDCPVFYFNMVASGDPVTVSGLTVTGGDSDGSAYSTGGISSYDADLTVQNAVVDNNYAPRGGGIYNFLGDITVSSSTVSGNRAFDYDGGGIHNFLGNITVSSSTVSGNYADDQGAGIHQFLGELEINSSTISGNGLDYSSVAGGGVYAFLYQPTITNSNISENVAKYGGGLAQFLASSTITESTFSGNASAVGGGVHSKYGGANIQRSTLNNNSAALGGGFFSYKPYYPTAFSNSTLAGNRAYEAGGGGAFATYNNPFTFSDTTVAANTAYGPDSDGGGLAFAFGSPTPALQNTIVSGNTATNGPDLVGTFDAAFSLVRDPSGAGVNTTVPNSNIFGVDPLLGGLANNGGTTQTMALPSNSPAVDKGSSSAGTDQRGSPRPVDGVTIANSAAAGADGADMGAFEAQGLPAPRCKGKPATIAASGAPPGTIKGTNKRDVIVGTNKKDKINSRGGNDLVCAKGGKDTVNGGGGKDKLFGQGGKDKLLGKGGKDKLVGGAKKDTLKGGAGNDSLKGGGGKDKLVGQGGKDKLVGGGGNDTCVGGPGKDTEKSC